MPSSAFLSAAAAAHRQPVALLTIEGLTGAKYGCDDSTDWAAYKSKSATVLYVAGEGVTIRDNLLMSRVSEYSYSGVPRDSSTGLLVQSLVTGVRWNNTTWTVATKRMMLQPATYCETDWVTAMRNRTASGWSYADEVAFLPYVNADMTTGPGKLDAASLVTATIFGGAVTAEMTGTVSMVAAYPSGTITTKTIDCGSTPSAPPTLEVDDIQPPGTAVSYTVRGSTNGTTWVDLGAKSDGSSLTAYRYYDVTATLTSSSGLSPVLKSIMIVVGNYEYLSTHADEPIAGARPLLQEGGVSSLSCKLDLVKPATVGELSVKLVMTRDTSNLIGAGVMRGKAVSCAIGFRGLAAGDYEPYFSGFWNDWSYDHKSRSATIKIRDCWKRLKNQLPKEPTSGTTTTALTPITVANGTNVMDALLQIIDAAGVPERMLDRASFTALRDVGGARYGSNWLLSGRSVSKQETVEDLLHSLATIAGVFLIPTPAGRLKAKVFDASAAAVATLDARYCDFASLEGNQKDLKTRQIVYYGLTSGKDGSSKEDYTTRYVLIDATTESTYAGEIIEQEHLEPWGATAYAVQQLASRRAGWFLTPKLSVKCSNLPPRWLGTVGLGDLVAVDGLTLPVATASLPASGLYTTSGKKFLIVGLNIDPKTMSLSLDLLEV